MSYHEYRCKYCMIVIDKNNMYCHECIKPLPKNVKDRVQNEKYIFDDKIVVCKGRILNCIHNIRRTQCEDKNCIDLDSYCIHEIPVNSCNNKHCKRK
jgi:hypothetical protein